MLFTRGHHSVKYKNEGIVATETGEVLELGLENVA
jgi:hypothetical protein